MTHLKINWQENEFSVNGNSFFYYRMHGKKEKPPVVFLHGFAEYGLDGERLCENLKGENELVMPDARAHGGTDGPPSEYSLLERIADAAACIKHLNLKNSFLIGHSMGANTAAGLAARYTDWFRGVVLIDPSFVLPVHLSYTESEGQEILAHWRRSYATWQDLSEEKLYRFCKARYPNWEEADYHHWVYGKKNLKENTLQGYIQPVPDWRGIMEKVNCPVLLVSGDSTGEAIVTEEVVQKCGELCPKFRHVNFPQSGHYIHHDACSRLQKEIHKFLAEVS